MNGAPWGGSEELWYRTALTLAKNGQKVGCAIYAWPDKEQRLLALEKAGCTVFRLPNKKTVSGNFLQKIIQKQNTKAALPKVIDTLPFDEYELVVINQGGLEVMTSPWQHLYRRLWNYVLLFHNYNEQDQFTATQKEALSNWIKNARRNMFAAKKAQEVLQQQLGIPINNGDVFLNPISFTPPAAPADYPDLQNGNYVFSVFAALDVNRKAQDKLISCFSSDVWKTRPWILHLYGEGKDRQLLQTTIERNGLQEKIFLKGHTDNVAQAMQNSHLILQITQVDAMPLSVVEAMAIGRPLVVSDVGDMAEWVRHGENGWVTPFSPPLIDQILEEAWQKRGEWKKMGLRSFELFQQRYPKNIEERFLQQLRTL